MKRFCVFALFSGLAVGALTTAANAQALNWTIDQPNYVDVGGVPGRTGVGAAVFNSNMYFAFSAANDSLGDGLNDDYVHIFANTVAANGDQRALTTSGGYLVSDANPSLTTTGQTLLNPPYLYMALNSAQQSYGGATAAYRSTDGVHFALAPQPSLSYTDYSPSLTTDPATSDVYLGVRNAADSTVSICRLAAATDQWTCHSFPGTTQIGFNPGLAWWNNTLYIGFVNLANNHNLGLYASTDQGQTISGVSNIYTDQSSANPSLAVYNNVLYVGFRSNDSGNNLLYKYTVDGANFSSSLTTNNTKLGGAPMLVYGGTTTINGFANHLWNFNSANDSTNYLWMEYAN
jgi:hypothetical protein